ncbi:MAG: AhpC/TSA family protein [Tannerella sp.]|jgi:thiol-disulfide isomerase/thioredoxin|nr:AhpC/TSA family protein [Tannerella sp.]
MKKFFIFLCASILFASCMQKQKLCVINGTVPDEYEGLWVFMIDFGTSEIIDSALVADGRFSFSVLPDTINFVSLATHEDLLFFGVIREAGVISANLSEQKIDGTPLNDEWNSCRAKLMNLDTELSEYMTRNPDEPDESVINAIILKQDAVKSNYLDANRNNAIGKYIFIDWLFSLSPEKADSLYALMGEDVKNQEYVQQLFQEYIRHVTLVNENIKQTEVGKLFTDFTVENGNPDGSPVSLSNYVGKGKYVLVDFWASWCGPCIAESPVIAEVYRKYGGDRFDVLGVAVWDEREASLKAIREHDITWPQILDAQTAPAELYGIAGIPHIILFGPDGTILARDLRGDALKSKVADVMKSER